MLKYYYSKVYKLSVIEENMDTRKILKILLYVILSFVLIAILIYLSLDSNFAKANNKNDRASDAGYKMKVKYYKEVYNSTKFKRNVSNENILSLGHFTVNVNNNKLILKVSIETEEDTIDKIMNTQSVIRNDVIDSVTNLKSLNINQGNISKAIKNALNNRLRRDVIKEVYFEEFIIQ